MADLARYAAVERQKVDGGYRSRTRYVRLHEEPMALRDVLPWLEAEGFVKCEPSADPDGTGRAWRGWGSTYFAVPWEKSVPR